MQPSMLRVDLAQPVEEVCRPHVPLRGSVASLRDQGQLRLDLAQPVEEVCRRHVPLGGSVSFWQRSSARPKAMMEPSMLHLDGPSPAVSRLPDINGKKRTFDEETSEEERTCEDKLRAEFEARANRSLSVSAIQRGSMADHPSAGPADHPNSSMPPAKSVRNFREK